MSFKDTFTRDSSGKENLQYDDVAFHHFFITILLVIMIPILYSIIKKILNPFGHLPRLKDIEQKRQFEQKVKKFKKDNRYAYITNGFVFKIILLIFLFVGIGFSFIAIMESSQQIKGFDPYQILGVDQDAPIQKIKKAYRKLALIYHPDRNKDNPQASAKFIMISKAYECLTDQQAKQKCLKYGNPQGSNSFNVGIALPSFLIKKQNHVVIMGFIFVIIVIILPAFLIQYHSQLNKYDDFGMLSQNHKFIHGLLNQHYSFKDCVKTFAVSYEFKQLKITKNQIPKLQAMLKNADQDVLNYIKKKNLIPYMKKPLLLISTRINGLPQKNDRGQSKVGKQLQEDYRAILKKIPILVKATVMIGVSRSVQMVQKQQHFVGYSALNSLILFGQYFIQGKSFTDSESFQQLPLTQDQIQKIRKKKKNKKINDIRALVYNTEQKQFLLSLLEQRRQSFIGQCIDYFPKIQLTTFVKTQGDHEIAVYDAFKVNIEAKSNRKSNFCSANNYPFLKVQGWYLIVTNGNAVVFMEHFNFDQEFKEFKFDYRQQKHGSYSLTVNLLSDCYFGLDIQTTLKYEVKPARKHVEQEDDKHDHDEEQSFFSKMMQSIIPTQQEEVSDKQDNEDEETTTAKAQNKKLKEQKGQEK